MADEGSVGNLLLYLVYRIEQCCLAHKYQAVGVGNVLQRLFIDAVLTCYLHVDTAIFRLLGADDIWGHILREGRTGLDHRTLSDTRLGVLDDAGGEDDSVLDDAVAGNLRAVAEDAAVADFRVVGDVGTLHQHVVVAEDSLATGVGGAVDDDVFADDVTVADDTFRLLAAELKVLG